MFDNALNHVQNNIKVVRREMSDKLCRIPVEQVVVGRGKDESNILNRQSRVSTRAVSNLKRVTSDRDLASVVTTSSGLSRSI